MISKSKLIDATAVRAMLLCMHRIRQFEEAAGLALKDGHVRGSVHQYSGEEAIATGICHHLLEQDFVSSYHRGHGHAIAKGVSPEVIAQRVAQRKLNTRAWAETNKERKYAHKLAYRARL